MRQQYTSIQNVQYHLDLARLCTSFRAYDLAFAEMRLLLEQQPDCWPAFAMGGELIVRYKLGVLPFRGMEYLYGNQSRKRPGAIVEEAEVAAVARRAGVGNQFSVLYNRIGLERYQDRDMEGAVRAFESALAFHPGNSDAAVNLQRIQQSYKP
jgi:hypothetical protein